MSCLILRQQAFSFLCYCHGRICSISVVSYFTYDCPLFIILCILSMGYVFYPAIPFIFYTCLLNLCSVFFFYICTLLVEPFIVCLTAFFMFLFNIPYALHSLVLSVVSNSSAQECLMSFIFFLSFFCWDYVFVVVTRASFNAFPV